MGFSSCFFSYFSYSATEKQWYILYVFYSQKNETKMLFGGIFGLFVLSFFLKTLNRNYCRFEKWMH